jgi:hypothetical protein
MKLRLLFWLCALCLIGIGGAFLLALPFQLMMCDAMN